MAPITAAPGVRASGRAGTCLGLVPYLNVAPMAFGLDRDPRFEMWREVPSLLAEALHEGRIDIGVLPTIEYAFGRYSVVPDIAITSRGPVRSVVLLHKVPLRELRRVALDRSSRTSVALLRILLRERLGREPEYVSLPPIPERMLAEADAALLIGDPALDAKHVGPIWDLGEAWQELTGLPFVYAFWAGRPGAAGVEVVRALREALRDGLASLPAIAEREAQGDPEKAARNLQYLRQNIRYTLGEPELAGLRLFYRKARALDLIPNEPEIVFHASE